MASPATATKRPRGRKRDGHHLRLVPAPSRPAPRGSRAADSNRRIILLLLSTTGMLTVVGLVMVLSASSVSAYARYGSTFLYLQRQAIYAVVGIGALLLAARMRYTVWQRLSLPFLGVTVVLLMLVLHPAAGTVVGGSARWIALGPITIQPSEMAKLSIVVFAATILTRNWGRLNEPRKLLLPLLPVVGLVSLLILLQPDLGTTMILAGSVFVLLFAAGVRLRYLFVAGLAGGAAALLLALSKSYMRARLLGFLHPFDDPQNKGYQLIQSLIALGSGGWTGVGLGASRQKWGTLPNAHTDFIFSILGEELGLLGELVVLTLFGLMIYAAVRIATRAPDVFGRLLASGIVAWLGLQILVNLGAVTGLLPVTGVPLPLLSFGGSSLVVTLAAVGILISIARTSPSPRASRRAPASANSSAGKGRRR